MNYTRALHFTAMLLVIAGALNWGSIAVFETDLVETLIPDAQIERYIKMIVGVAGVFIAYRTALTFMNQ
jgi:uncharacterized membrane protein YuzA (DUF378 family)